MVSVFHVAPSGSDSAPGREESPLRTINRAAQLARPGDTVLVHEGEYREWVRPARGGLSDARRITYAAAEGEHVVIKGSERITGWKQAESTVWQAEIDNAVFGDFNPFVETIDGDWLVSPAAGETARHLGDVYLNGRGSFEVSSKAELFAPALSTSVRDDWTGTRVTVESPEHAGQVWFAEVGEKHTTLLVNFQGADPNSELVEINVRRSVFFPTKHNLDFITVRGFELAQAATPWAPPTANQAGLIGPNWAKGWIIEDNRIHDSKCAGISLGKEASTGDNYSFDRGDKPGYQYQLESVFRASSTGWDKEHIGSHIVRRNEIFDCGQNAIVGHLGCAFSTIEDNHIHHIALKREFYGHEIAGIKLHAAIDTKISHNRIHDCSLGIWLDWQTQGTQISRNVLYRNSRDLFIEVSHGPYVVNHNVLASAAALEIVSQGGAYLHNLVGGSVRLEAVLDRATPYHLPHSTTVAGYATICGGDDRFIGNIFFGGDLDTAYVPGGFHHNTSGYGTAGYNGYPADSDQYYAGLDSTLGDHERFHGIRQPVHLRQNVYLPGATPFDQEIDPLVVTETASISVLEEDDGVYLSLKLPTAVKALRVSPIDAVDLGHARYPDAEFEDPNGLPLRFNLDLINSDGSGWEAIAPGPLNELPDEANVRIW